MNQKGLAPLVVLIGIMIVSSIGAVIFFKGNYSFPRVTKNENQATTSANLNTPTPPTPSSSPSTSPKTSPTASQTTSKPVQTSNSPTPTPKSTTLKTIAISVFAYDDRTGNGMFDSDDVGLANMKFCFYDSYDQSNQGCLWTVSDGYISQSFYVRGNLVVEPFQYNNFTPSSGKKEFSSSTQGVKFAFRSATIPSADKVGVLEGDFFNDTNENGVFDSGEERIYFYKLYLVDENNGGYYTVDGAQATDSSGHFKYVELPINKTYKLILSTIPELYKVNKTEYSFSFSPTKTTISDLKIPVVKK